MSLLFLYPHAYPHTPSQAASPASARELCTRVGARREIVPAAEIAAMVTACTAARADIKVSEGLCGAIENICREKGANREACGGCGVIPAVVSAMSAHAAVNLTVATKGCEALGNLSNGNSVNADAIISSSDGLNAIFLVMTTYPRVEVQRVACKALYLISKFATPARLVAMRASRAVELLEAARKSFPKPGGGTVKERADEALEKLFSVA